MMHAYTDYRWLRVCSEGTEFKCRKHGKEFIRYERYPILGVRKV